MKNTGMARKLDDLGRVVIPAEMRKSFGIKEGDFLEISVEENRIILSKREDACVFCRATADLKEYRGRMVCAGCISELSGSRPDVPEITPGDPADLPAWEPFTEG